MAATELIQSCLCGVRYWPLQEIEAPGPFILRSINHLPNSFISRHPLHLCLSEQ